MGTLRHSCEIAPNERFTRQYREWVEKFPIKELDNIERDEESGSPARKMENAATQSPPESKDIAVNLEKLERLTRRVGNLKMRQTLNKERQQELEYKERKMNMQRATVNALKQCALVLDIHSTALRRPQKVEFKDERKTSERTKRTEKKVGSPKQTREQKKREMKIEKALKERLEKIKPKPQLKILPPIALKGTQMEKEDTSPKTSKPSFIPSITLYHKPRMGRTSRDNSPDQDAFDLGELDSPIQREGRNSKPPPFTLTSGQYYHRVNVMGNERRGSLLTGQKSKSPGTSSFNKKNKVHISVKKIGTPVYSKAQKVIKGHTRGYPSLTPIKIPHLSVLLDQEFIHRSMDDNYPSREESESPGAGYEPLDSIPVKATYEDAITSLLLDRRARLEGWEEDQKSKGFDTLNALEINDRFSKD